MPRTGLVERIEGGRSRASSLGTGSWDRQGVEYLSISSRDSGQSRRMCDRLFHQLGEKGRDCNFVWS